MEKNVAIGYHALRTQDAGADAFNIAIGHNTGTAITTGTLNTIVGGLAGDALTEGTSNTALGYSTLSAATTSDFNIAIGTESLRNNILSNRNVAVGFQSLFHHNTTNATDAYNTAVGFKAGNAVTTGTDNTIGWWFSWRCAYNRSIKCCDRKSCFKCRRHWIC